MKRNDQREAWKVRGEIKREKERVKQRKDKRKVIFSGSTSNQIQCNEKHSEVHRNTVL